MRAHVFLVNFFGVLTLLYSLYDLQRFLRVFSVCARSFFMLHYAFSNWWMRLLIGSCFIYVQPFISLNVTYALSKRRRRFLHFLVFLFCPFACVFLSCSAFNSLSATAPSSKLFGSPLSLPLHLTRLTSDPDKYEYKYAVLYSTCAAEDSWPCGF